MLRHGVPVKDVNGVDRLGTRWSRDDTGRAVPSGTRTALWSLTGTQAGALQSTMARPVSARALERRAAGAFPRSLGDGARTGRGPGRDVERGLVLRGRS